MGNQVYGRYSTSVKVRASLHQKNRVAEANEGRKNAPDLAKHPNRYERNTVVKWGRVIMKHALRERVESQLSFGTEIIVIG